jgi:hypothetical protein
MGTASNRLWTVAVAVMACVLAFGMHGCGEPQDLQTQLTSVFRQYMQAIRAGDGESMLNLTSSASRVGAQNYLASAGKTAPTEAEFQRMAQFLPATDGLVWEGAVEQGDTAGLYGRMTGPDGNTRYLGVRFVRERGAWCFDRMQSTGGSPGTGPTPAPYAEAVGDPKVILKIDGVIEPTPERLPVAEHPAQFDVGGWWCTVTAKLNGKLLVEPREGGNAIGLVPGGLKAKGNRIEITVAPGDGSAKSRASVSIRAIGGDSQAPPLYQFKPERGFTGTHTATFDAVQ